MPQPEWSAHPHSSGQCVNCAKTVHDSTMYVSRAVGGVFCADCYTDGDPPLVCEIHTTIDDTDAGGPYDFTPCDKPATRIIQWTTPGGQTLTLGVCAFHATGEL